MKNLILKSVALFAGISDDNIPGLLKCLSAQTKTYQKNETIFGMGDRVSSVGVVCSGNVQVVKEDYLGNRTIIAILQTGDLFAEAFVCAKTETLPVRVAAASESEILLIDYGKIINTCPSSCVFHKKLIENMLGIIANKNVMLNQRVEVLSERSTRDKLLSYLSSQALSAKSKFFTIPFNRQELADYLCVDRSAMSFQLCKLRDEGVLKFNKSWFELL